MTKFIKIPLLNGKNTNLAIKELAGIKQVKETKEGIELYLEDYTLSSNLSKRKFLNLIEKAQEEYSLPYNKIKKAKEVQEEIRKVYGLELELSKTYNFKIGFKGSCLYSHYDSEHRNEAKITGVANITVLVEKDVKVMISGIMNVEDLSFSHEERMIGEEAGFSAEANYKFDKKGKIKFDKISNIIGNTYKKYDKNDIDRCDIEIGDHREFLTNIINVHIIHENMSKELSQVMNNDRYLNTQKELSKKEREAMITSAMIQARALEEGMEALANASSSCGGSSTVYNICYW